MRGLDEVAVRAFISSAIRTEVPPIKTFLRNIKEFGGRSRENAEREEERSYLNCLSKDVQPHRASRK